MNRQGPMDPNHTPPRALRHGRAASHAIIAPSPRAAPAAPREGATRRQTSTTVRSDIDTRQREDNHMRHEPSPTVTGHMGRAPGEQGRTVGRPERHRREGLEVAAATVRGRVEHTPGKRSGGARPRSKNCTNHTKEVTNRGKQIGKKTLKVHHPCVPTPGDSTGGLGRERAGQNMITKVIKCAVGCLRVNGHGTYIDILINLSRTPPIRLPYTRDGDRSSDTNVISIVIMNSSTDESS